MTNMYNNFIHNNGTLEVQLNNNKKNIKNLYKERMFEHIETLKEIQVNQMYDANQFDWKTGKVTLMEYKDKVGNEYAIIDKLYDVVQENNKMTCISGLPSCGKTYALANVIKNNNKERLKVNEKDFNSREHIIVYCVPNRNQAIQISKEYDWIRRVVGGDTLTTKTLEENPINVLVFEKLMELLGIYKDDESILDFISKFKITLIIDEAHTIIQDAYRKNTIDLVVKTINKLKEIGANIIFTTASFEALVPFAFDETICFFSNNNSEVPRTSIIIKPEDLKEQDFIANEISKKLQEGKVVYCRLQNKTMPDGIMKKINESGNFSYVKINREESDKGNNDAITSVIEESKLPYYDCYFCTSMIDAGTNIKTIDDIGDKEICAIFVYNNKNYNISNIEQSFNRLRFNYKERKILLIDSSYDIEEMKLSTIIKEEKEKIEKDRVNLNNLYEGFKLYRKEEAKKLLKLYLKTINEDGTMSIKNLYFNEDTDSIEIDEIGFFRYCREQIYMKQFLNPDLLKKELQKVLGGEIVFEIAHDKGLRVEKEIVNKEDIRKDFKEMSMEESRMKKFDSYVGEDFDKYRNEEIFEMYCILRRKYDLKDTFELIANREEKELKLECRNISIEELKSLNDNDRKALLDLHNKKVCEYEYNKEKVSLVRIGLFKEFLVTLLDRTNNVEKTINIICDSKNDNQINETIIDLQAKTINEYYKKGLPAAGAFARKQYAFVSVIEKLKGSSTLSLYKDNCSKLDTIVEEMRKQGFELKTNDIMKLAKRIYKGRNIKKQVGGKEVKGYLLKELN